MKRIQGTRFDCRGGIFVKELAHSDKSSIDEILEKRIEKAQYQKGRQRFVVGIVGVIAGAYVLMGVIFGIAIINGMSMKPALYDKDLALLYRLDPQYEYGDIIVLKKGEEDHLAKRVVGVPGDTIDIDNEKGMLVRNGELIEETYIFAPTLLKDYGVELPVILSEKEYFVMGDNRESSQDSRSFGSVKKSEIVGRILGVAGKRALNR